MPNFLENAFDQYRRGWEQLYGQPYVQPATTTAAGPLVNEAPYNVPGAAPSYYGMLPVAPVSSEGTFVGAPLGSGQQQQQQQSEWERNPSELSQTDINALAESGRGRANLTMPSEKLTDVGGGAQGDMFAPLESLAGSLYKAKFGGGAGQGAGATAPAGATPGTTEMSGYDINTDAGMRAYLGIDGGGGGAGGGGFGGFGGMSGANMASGISGVLSSFANQVAKNAAPMTVRPDLWAGPVPTPLTFTPPTLARNTGGGFV
jgi:hypothetical protein